MVFTQERFSYKIKSESWSTCTKWPLSWMEHLNVLVIVAWGSSGVVTRPPPFLWVPAIVEFGVGDQTHRFKME